MHNRAETAPTDSLLAKKNLEIILCSNGQSIAMPSLKAEEALAIEPEDRGFVRFGSKLHVIARVLGISTSHFDLATFPGQVNHHIRGRIFVNRNGDFRMLVARAPVGEVANIKLQASGFFFSGREFMSR